MKTSFAFPLTTLLALGFVAHASAWTDGFEAYAPGSNLAGQGGWQGWGGDVSVGGTVTTAQAAGGTQALQILKDNDTVQPFFGITSGLWSVNLQQYAPATSGGVTWTVLMNGYHSSLNWSLELKADLGAGMVEVQDGWGVQQGVRVPLLRDQWVDLRFDINLDANSVSAYYNHSLLATYPWQTGGINAFQALDLYGDSSQIGPVYYDNVSVVPEPAALALLTLGGLALAFRRKLS